MSSTPAPSSTPKQLYDTMDILKTMTQEQNTPDGGDSFGDLTAETVSCDTGNETDQQTFSAPQSEDDGEFNINPDAAAKRARENTKQQSIDGGKSRHEHKKATEKAETNQREAEQRAEESRSKAQMTLGEDDQTTGLSDFD